MRRDINIMTLHKTRDAYQFDLVFWYQEQSQIDSYNLALANRQVYRAW
jgi:hypothetical protein